MIGLYWPLTAEQLQAAMEQLSKDAGEQGTCFFCGDKIDPLALHIVGFSSNRHGHLACFNRKARFSLKFYVGFYDG